MSVKRLLAKIATGGRGPSSLKGLLDGGYLTVAKQPKDNQLVFSAKADTRLYLFPIDHDYPGRSAAMHNAVFQQFGMNRRAAFVIGAPKDVGAIMHALREDPIYAGGGAGSGFKDTVIPFLDRLDPVAEAVGAANVIAREGRDLVGYNTDGLGFVVGLLSEYPRAIIGRKVVILGAGGTAAPIAYEIAKKTPRELVILNRTVSRAERIADMIRSMTDARAGGEDLIGAELESADLVINTSNKGAQPNEAFSAFAPMTGDADADLAVSRANLERLPKAAIVADILLEEDTLTLKLARERGHPIHSGRLMNLHQAVPAFKLMTGLTDDALQSLMANAPG